jgi:hypothetical protein
MGSAFSIWFRTTDHLARNGCDFPDTEEQETDEVRCRITFGPLEVDMWQAIGLISHGQQ